jgi:hypothetical protein
MRIVACNASHLTVLKTLRLPQGFDLIGHMVVFAVRRLSKAVVFLQFVTRTVRKGWTAMANGVAVALRTDFDQSFTRQPAWVDNSMG